MRKPALDKIKPGSGKPPAAALSGKRPVHLGDGFRATPTYRRDALRAGNRVKGPALIEEHASTTVLMSGDAMTVYAYGSLLMTVGGRT